jgi:putative transcriptional regulator
MSETKKSGARRAAAKPTGMSIEAFGELMAGMEDVRAFQKGERRGFAVRGQDVKAIRAKTKLSQPQFAEAFHLDVAALRDWEQGRRQPERAAQVLLALIEREPETVQRILAVRAPEKLRFFSTARPPQELSAPSPK